MPRFLRIARVVFGVAVASMVAGAVASIPVTTVFVLMITRNGHLDYLGVWAVGATFGAACGLLLGPATAFGFLRGAPFGRLFVETSAGAGLGGAIGALSWDGRFALLGAGIGLVASVAHLFCRYRTKPAPRARMADQAPRGA